MVFRSLPLLELAPEDDADQEANPERDAKR